MMKVINVITYTILLDGHRLEQSARLERVKKLTYRGAENILKKHFGNGTIVVTRIEAIGID